MGPNEKPERLAKQIALNSSITCYLTLSYQILDYFPVENPPVAILTLLEEHLELWKEVERMQC